MTNKERVLAALSGKPLDRMPVTVLYSQLYLMDHFAELTGRPQGEMWKWLTASPEEHISIYLEMSKKVPFDILIPCEAPSRAERENTEFIEREGKILRHDKITDIYYPLPEPISGHATDMTPPHEQTVFTISDAAEKVKIPSAEEMIAEGCNDYLEALLAAVGESEFILSGGIIGTIYGCGGYVGMGNVYGMLIENPDLIEYLSWKIVEQNIERIRLYAAAGGEAIWIDDATATSDMISVAHYERFSLPFIKAMVEEIHRVGKKAIVIYFGGVADRLEQIVATGADALAMETSMKGYVNDIDEIAKKIGKRITLFGNIDPLRVLEQGSEEELEREILRQVAAGKQAVGFLICTGSPITPRTPLARVQRFIELGRKYGSNC